MTPEQIIGATVGALIVIGGGTIAVLTFLKRFGMSKCPEVCPEPECKAVVGNTHDKVTVLIEGQNNVKEALENKRKKIEGLQTDTTVIMTDVKWIVKELQRQNET